ncbi:MAG TPA: hypothetical protein VD834_16610 [Blastococcus sp.]|nr:hypothetical protein [Nocardioides sp.]HYH26969.1 hypothetical protein [Blastococcus sp.]
MPPRNTTPKPEPKVSPLDQMGEDAEQSEQPAEYPVGAPEFKVYLAVRPRSRRGEFKRLLAELTELNPQLRAEQAAISEIKDQAAREAASMRLWARMDEMYEIVEKALRLVAVDVEKFDAWAAEVSDEDLQTTWAVYQMKAQPGEASSSAS